MILKDNTLVFADSLEFLERVESNIADLIYLDPPWNTSSDIFNPKDSSDASKRREEYNEFIFKIIQQSHRVLKPTGNLILYSNPALNVNFHNIISPIYKLSNFRAEFIIPKRQAKRIPNNLLNNHDTVIHYSKTNQYYFNPTVELKRTEVEKIFPLEDKDGRYRLSDLTLHGKNETLSFDWQGFNLPPGKVWRFSKEKLNELLDENKIFLKSDLFAPKLKEYASDKTVSALGSVWDDIPAFDNRTDYFGMAQSKEIMQRVISISSKENDLVIDPFAGSGTTLVVAKELKRRWVGIDNFDKSISLCKRRLLRIKKAQTFNNLEIEDLRKHKIIWNHYILLSDSEKDAVIKRISSGENERVEFKESLVWNNYSNKRDGDLADKVMREITAFMNSNLGGILYLGVKDDGSIVGLDKDYGEANPQKANSDGYALFLSSKIRSELGPSAFNLYQIRNYILNNKPICEIEVSPSAYPIFYKNDYYVRNGTQAVKLNTEEFYQHNKDYYLHK